MTRTVASQHTNFMNLWFDMYFAENLFNIVVSAECFGGMWKESINWIEESTLRSLEDNSFIVF